MAGPALTPLQNKQRGVGAAIATESRVRDTRQLSKMWNGMGQSVPGTGMDMHSMGGGNGMGMGGGYGGGMVQAREICYKYLA